MSANFWKDTWELRKKIFGLPTLEDVLDAYKLGTLPVQEAYVCRHSTGDPNVPTLWTPYSQLEPMRILSEKMEKKLGEMMWGKSKI